MALSVAKRATFGASNNRVLLRIDRRLDAFTAATPSNKRTFEHHVEGKNCFLPVLVPDTLGPSAKKLTIRHADNSDIFLQYCLVFLI